MEPEQRAVSERAVTGKSKMVFGDWFAVLAGIATIAGTVLFVLIPGRYSPRESSSMAEANAQIAALRKEIAELDELAVRESVQLKTPMPAPAPEADRIAGLTADVSALQSQMKALDDAIGQSPDKALAVPLLQRDVDNMRETNREELGTSQAEIDRVYDENKWFIGLMFTMALGLVTLAASNLLQVRKAKDS